MGLMGAESRAAVGSYDNTPKHEEAVANASSMSVFLTVVCLSPSIPEIQVPSRIVLLACHTLMNEHLPWPYRSRLNPYLDDQLT